MRKLIPAALAAAALLSVSAPAMAHDAAELARNKATVLAFLDTAFARKQVDEAFARYVGDDYIQHSPRVPTGKAPMIATFKAMLPNVPTMKIDVKRVMADGDLVAVHHHLTMGPGDRGQAIVDIFRLKDGRIVEHWDVIQAVPEKAEHNNTMF